MPHKETINRVKNIGEKVRYRLAGGEYTERQNARISPENRKRIEEFQSKSLKNKILTVGGYLLRKKK